MLPFQISWQPAPEFSGLSKICRDARIEPESNSRLLHRSQKAYPIEPLHLLFTYLAEEPGMEQNEIAGSCWAVTIQLSYLELTFGPGC